MTQRDDADAREPRSWAVLSRARSGDNGRLEDLFLADEHVTVGGEEGRTPWLARAALATLGLSVVVYFGFRLIELDPPYLLVIAVCAGGVAVRLAARTVAEASWLRTAETVRRRPVTDMITAAGWYEGGDGMLEAVRRWDRRLEWGASAPERYAVTVAPRLAELADERLRQRFGVTVDGDPARARQVLGEPVWTALHPPAGWAPTVRQLADVVARLDAIGRDQV